MFHVGEPLLHDRQHLEIGRSDLPRETLAARVILGAFAFGLLVELLLLVETTDDFLQAGFHVAGDVAGLAQVLDDRGGKQPNRGRIGQCRLREQQDRRCEHQSQRRLSPGDIDAQGEGAFVIHLAVLVVAVPVAAGARDQCAKANAGPMNTS